MPEIVGVTAVKVNVGTYGVESFATVWLVPPGVETVRKYAKPELTAGVIAWIHVGSAQPGVGF
jgi:hypothetical protein